MAVTVTKTLLDIANPKVPLISEETFNRFLNKKDERLHNSVVRKDPMQDFWAALYEDRENFKNYKVEGKSIDEIIRDLRD